MVNLVNSKPVSLKLISKNDYLKLLLVSVFTVKGVNLSKWRCTPDELKSYNQLLVQTGKNCTKEVKVLLGLFNTLKGWKPSKEWFASNLCTFKDLQVSGAFP